MVKLYRFIFARFFLDLANETINILILSIGITFPVLIEILCRANNRLYATNKLSSCSILPTSTSYRAKGNSK